MIYLLWKESNSEEIVFLITHFLEQHLSSKSTTELFIKIFVEMLKDFDSENNLKGDSFSSHSDPNMASE